MKSACQDTCSCVIKAFSWQQAHYLLMLHRHSMDSRSSRRSSYRQALDLSQAGQNPRYRQSVDLSPYRQSTHHPQSFDIRPSAAQSFDSSKFRQSTDFLQPLEPYDSLLHRQPTPYRQSMDFTRPGQHSFRYRQSHEQQAPPTQDPYPDPIQAAPTHHPNHSYTTCFTHLKLPLSRLFLFVFADPFVVLVMQAVIGFIRWQPASQLQALWGLNPACSAARLRHTVYGVTSKAYLPPATAAAAAGKLQATNGSGLSGPIPHPPSVQGGRPCRH